MTLFERFDAIAQKATPDDLGLLAELFFQFHDDQAELAAVLDEQLALIEFRLLCGTEMGGTVH